MGRMGYPMAERLVKAGYEVRIWNRTRSKAEPLAGKGARSSTARRPGRRRRAVHDGVDRQGRRAGLFRRRRRADGDKTPRHLRRLLVDRGRPVADPREACGARRRFVASPVSGNGKCVKAGKLSSVVLGPARRLRQGRADHRHHAGNGVSYVGEGELARFCKIAHNVFLGVVIQNLAEITILAQKAGVPRHAFLDFMNNSVMGSMFTALQDERAGQPRLDHDLHAGAPAQGPRPRPAPRALGVPMPVTAATREALQAHFGAATLKDDPEAYLADGFRGADRDRGAGRGAEASEREHARTRRGWIRLARRRRTAG
jgi:3-hydroxyisobutyrate dehydrogenase